MAFIEILLGLLYLTGGFLILCLFLFFVRDFIDGVFYEDKGVIKTIRDIVKPGSAREVFGNIALGECSKKHDRVKHGLYVLVDQKTGEVKIKDSSRPDDGLIASGTRDS